MLMQLHTYVVRDSAIEDCRRPVEECKFLILSGPTCSQSWVQRLKAANTQILGTFYNVVLGLAPSKDTRTLGHSKVNAVSFLFPIVSLTSELGGWRGRQKGTVCSSSASRAAAEVELLTHSFSWGSPPSPLQLASMQLYCTKQGWTCALPWFKTTPSLSWIKAGSPLGQKSSKWQNLLTGWHCLGGTS